jgi:two-component system, OmpR family, response regulator MprA
MPEAQRVLIVEDDEDIRETLAYTLFSEGYDARTACNGRDALGVIAIWAPDVIVLDLMMPVMDGPTFLRARTPGAPVLVLSAKIDAESSTDLPGVAQVIRKPFDLDELLDRLRTLTDHR